MRPALWNPSQIPSRAASLNSPPTTGPTRISRPSGGTGWGHLKSPEGEAFGYQITFFRAALRRPDPRARSAWSLNTVYFAHLAVTDPARGRFRFREKVGRAPWGFPAPLPTISRSGSTTGRRSRRVQVFIAGRGPGGGAGSAPHSPEPPALHGEGGFSRKAAL